LLEHGYLLFVREVVFVGVEKMARRGIEKYVSCDIISSIKKQKL
jgi:hypothetical protein